MKKISDKKESVNVLLIKDITNPAIIGKKKIKRISLEKLEEESWLP
ncbi:MAG TPA: hypothetical protein VJB11_00810 [archaeon]|nr:hypothetical protein [archaeon]